MSNLSTNTLTIVSSTSNNTIDSQKSTIEFLGFVSTDVDYIETSPTNPANTAHVMSRITSSHVGSNSNFYSKITLGTNDGSNNLSSIDGTVTVFPNAEIFVSNDIRVNGSPILVVQNSNGEVLNT